MFLLLSRPFPAQPSPKPAVGVFASRVICPAPGVSGPVRTPQPVTSRSMNSGRHGKRRRDTRTVSPSAQLAIALPIASGERRGDSLPRARSLTWNPAIAPGGEGNVIDRPVEFNAFEFAVLAGLRATQLSRGCTPRVPGAAKVTVTAQMEVAARKIVREPDARLTREVL